MKYKKPEISVLGSAMSAIQGTCYKFGIVTDAHPKACGTQLSNGAAYEADE
jgi:hypothetical protein